MSKGMRRQGRELALKVIYSMHHESIPAPEILNRFWSSFRFREDVLGDPHDTAESAIPYDVRRFAEELVLGVAEHMPHIDRIIEEFSTNWALERMARVDLSLLRMGTYELLYRPDIPINVVINEAIEVGKRYGTKETPSFVNGILDRISRVHRQSDQ